MEKVMAILVTGSTGVIGTQVLNHLDGSGVEVRALTRSPEKAQFPAGVTKVQGDLADVDGLRRAMNGVSTLFLLAPNAADELTQALQTLSVAREAGVKGVVYFSVFKGAEYVDVPHFTGKYTVERMIEHCDLPATVLRPAYFVQNDVRQKDPLLTHGVYGMPIGAKGISMVDVRDIGDAAARELLAVNVLLARCRAKRTNSLDPTQSRHKLSRRSGPKHWDERCVTAAMISTCSNSV
jgi:uncharacterized protein YbjT (DUF2867 family)